MLVTGAATDPGIYVWDGVRGQEAWERTAQLSAASGFRGLRVLMSPATRRTYELAYSHVNSLTAVFQSEAIQSVLQHREFRTVMFTAYDFASYRNQQYMDPRFLADNRQRIFDEYAELTEEIMRRESGSGRVFVIGHWEGDNQVYCGSSYKFLVNDSERANCLTHKPAELISGLTMWLQIRQEAIAAGRERAKKAGASGVDVWHAVEFNTLFHFRTVPGADIRGKEFHGVLDSVVPAVKPDVCSYSAWESLNPDRLGKDLKIILKACAPARLIIGELGYQPTGDRRDPTKDYRKAISNLEKQQENLLAVFFWEAFHQGFGIFGADGRAAWPAALDVMKALP